MLSPTLDSVIVIKAEPLALAVIIPLLSTVIIFSSELTKVRLLLTKQVGDIIKKGMSLLGIDCPEKM